LHPGGKNHVWSDETDIIVKVSGFEGVCQFGVKAVTTTAFLKRIGVLS
jgi:hypothetical protein